MEKEGNRGTMVEGSCESLDGKGVFPSVSTYPRLRVSICCVMLRRSLTERQTEIGVSEVSAKTGFWSP